jgi:hypothetical protein
LKEESWEVGGAGRGEVQLEGVYSGCMGWVHVPPPPLAAPKLLLKLYDFSISFGDFSFFL